MQGRRGEHRGLAVLQTVSTGEITRAVRDSRIDGLDIRQGHFIGLVDGKVLATGHLTGVAEEVALLLVREDSEVLTILVGDGDDNREAGEAAAALATRYSGRLQVDIHEGGQPPLPAVVVCGVIALS